MHDRIAVPGRSARLADAGRATLLRVGWLAHMPPAFQSAMLDIAIWRMARPGETLGHMGDSDGGMFGVARGIVEVALAADHPDTRLVHLGHAGFWAGARPLLGGPRLLNITARTDVHWCLLPQHALERVLATEPGWWRHTAQHSDGGLATALGIIADLSRQDKRLRTIAVLLRAAGCRYADAPMLGEAVVRLSQADVAAMAAMSRNTVSGICAGLEAEGLIEIGYRAMTLLQPRRMRAMLAE
jgi:CRP/FNR family cyclic AMP-dependent transcriptional regulator